jgi:hypothetical protein
MKVSLGKGLLSLRTLAQLHLRVFRERYDILEVHNAFTQSVY